MTRRLLLTLLTLALGFSCVGAPKVPNVPASRTLEIGQEDDASKADGPFRVVFGGPTGETDDPGEVAIVFSRPVHALEIVGEESLPTAKIAAVGTKGPEPVEGRWEWVGTHAVRFVPKDRLPRASQYRVEVPADSRALDGATLGKPYAFEFSTPRPRLERSEPWQGADHLTPSTHFDLRFNQPVAPAAVREALSITVDPTGRAAKIPFSVKYPDEKVKTRIEVTPGARLPLDSAVHLRLASTLRGVEGPRPAGVERVLKMRTYGPLRVERLECSHSTPHKRCAASGYFSVRFSNRVQRSEFMKHLSISGGAKIEAFRGGDHPSTSHGIPTELKAGRHYVATIAAGLKDEFGQTLARSVTLPLDTDDEWPLLEVGLSGSVFEAAGKGLPDAKVPLSTINVPSFKLAVAKLSKADAIRLETYDAPKWNQGFERIAKVKGAKTSTVRPSAAKNTQATHLVDVSSELAKTGGRGMLALAVAYRGARSSEREQWRVVARTDLGVSAKMSRFGSVVWVTRLSTGEPVGQAMVEVHDQRGKRFAGSTDKSGLVVIPPSVYRPVEASGSVDQKAAIVVSSGSDWTVKPVSDMLSPWRYSGRSDLSGGLEAKGVLITDRGVYRPGEKIRLKGLFRQPKASGMATPTGQRVAVAAYDGNDETFFEKRVKLGPFGDFSVDVPIPKSAPLGTFGLRADLGDASKNLDSGSAYTSVMVAAYKPAEFKVTVAPDRPEMVFGDTLGYDVSGDYLFGAPMGSGSARTVITHAPSGFSPKVPDGFATSDETYFEDFDEDEQDGADLAEHSGKLDAHGRYKNTFQAKWKSVRGPEVVRLESTIQDISRQTITESASVIVHPASVYVAMERPKEFFLPADKPIEPRLFAVKPDGKKVPGVGIELELVRRTWNTVVEEAGENGARYESRVVDKVISKCKVASAANAARCGVKPSGPGYYVLRARAKDGRGRKALASFGVYVLGKGDDVGWAATDASKLELVRNKASYRVGDHAKILVKSPYREADALITVERAGIIRRERRRLVGSMPTIDVPITDGMRPNAFVSVHLVRGRTSEKKAKKPDVGAPSFRLGYVELKVSPEDRRLQVDIKPSKRDYKPGEWVDCEVAVRDHKGKAADANVTFYAVDEGVLMLTGYKTPDPLPTFFAPRPLAVFSVETRDRMARVFRSALAPGGEDKGDDGGGGGGMDVRKDFRSTAYFAPAVLTRGGKAKVRFKLPDSLTSYRLMAVAASRADSFGLGDAEITTSRPLMARPALPRFLRAGDTMTAGIVVSTKGLKQTVVEAEIQAQGVRVAGPAKQRVVVPAGGSVELKWPISAPRVGDAKFTFRVTADRLEDRVEITRKVQSPHQVETVALYGSTKASSAEKLGDLSKVRPDIGSLEVRMSASALVGLDAGVDALLEYPYGCTEQLSSRLIPLVRLEQLKKTHDVTLPPKVAKVSDETVAKILANQGDDGSFGYFADSPASDPWVTTQAVWSLVLAKQAGHTVPKAALGRGLDAVRRELRRVSPLREDLAMKAFALDVLAVAGKPDPGYASKIYERRDDLPLFARGLLLDAMLRSGEKGEPVRDLAQDLRNHVRISTAGAVVAENLGDRYARFLDSTARTTAITMRSLARSGQDEETVRRLARGLLGMRKHGAWRTTQENAWALVALADYGEAYESNDTPVDAQAFFGGALVSRASLTARSMKTADHSTAMAALLTGAKGKGGTLAFRAGGGGLFYEARLRYAHKELPKKAVDRGFYVRKTVRALSPSALTAALARIPDRGDARATGGDFVLVDLVVVSPSPRENVVIDDPLAAGVEGIDSRLSTTSSAARRAEDSENVDEDPDGDERDPDDARAAGIAYTSVWSRREVRDDRVVIFVEHMPAGMFHFRYLARATTFGSFVVPPTRAECMYEPEVFGRTGATQFVVSEGTKP